MENNKLKCMLLVLSLLLLSACNQVRKSDTSQVVAKVDGVEITVHQLNYQMSRLPAENNAGSRKDVLDGLVNEQLLVNEAIKNKVDQDPNVLMQVEMAKRQIYAQDTIARIMKNTAAPDISDARKYYDQHAAQFSSRTKYKFHTFIIENVKSIDAFSVELDKSTTIEQTRKILSDAGVKYDERDTEVSTEQLPNELLAQFSKFKPGDIRVIHSATGYELSQLLSMQVAPLEFSQSVDLIKNRIKADAVRGKIAAELKDYRKKAQIEWIDSSASTAK